MGDEANFNDTKTAYSDMLQKELEHLEAVQTDFCTSIRSITNALNDNSSVIRLFTRHADKHAEMTKFSDDCNTLSRITESFMEKAVLREHVLFNFADSETEQEAGGGKKKSKPKKRIPSAATTGKGRK